MKDPEQVDAFEKEAYLYRTCPECGAAAIPMLDIDGKLQKIYCEADCGWEICRPEEEDDGNSDSVQNDA